MASIQWPWAVILCKFSDRPAEPLPIRYFADMFTEHGAGGICDYWQHVTCGAFDLSTSKVFGWFTVPHLAAEAAGLSATQGSLARGTFVGWARDIAIKNGVDLSPFKRVLALFGSPEPDHGAVSIPGDVVIAMKRATLFEFGFTCHEMGHGFGLPHSWAANPDFEYGDHWDLMSWQTSNFPFDFVFEDTNEGLATVGLNARNVEALQALPGGRAWIPPGPDFSERVVLDPLAQPAVGNRGSLVAKIPPNATRPNRPDQSTYTVEFRRKAGWDRAIPTDTILFHQVRTDGFSYIQPIRGASYGVGSTFTTVDPKVFIYVESFTAGNASATLRIWDIPTGSLRKEDSDPAVYLITNGVKRWVPSPNILMAMGKSWADVKSVPDGGLSTIPVGAPVGLLQVSVSPYPVPLGRQVTVTVSAKDSSTSQDVAGEVVVDGVTIGQANHPFTHTFKKKQVSVDPQHHSSIYVSPSGHVSPTDPQYSQTPINFGFPPPTNTP